MGIKINEIAKGVRVKLNSNFQSESLNDEYLQCEEVIYIADKHVYNDMYGDYVAIRGGSKTNSGFAYLDQLDLEFPYEEVQYPVYYKTDNKPIKKEFIGFTAIWAGGVPVFFSNDNKCQFDLKVNDTQTAFDLYSKRLKITIEEIVNDDDKI